MMVPDEFRMTASQCWTHPVCFTSDSQDDIAWDRPHPDSVQSVPIEPDLSQKLSVTLQLFGVMFAVIPSGSLVVSLVVSSVVSLVVSFGDADDASGSPGFETAPVPLLGSGDVGESTPQANMAAAETEMQNTPIVRSI